MLTLRLQRTGRKKLAHYRLIAQEHSRSPKSGRVVEFLGSFNPYKKELIFEKEKVEKHLKNGAQPSNKVAKLLKNNGVKLPSWVTITQRKEHKKEEVKEEPKVAEASEEASEEASVPDATTTDEVPEVAPVAEDSKAGDEEVTDAEPEVEPVAEESKPTEEAITEAESETTEAPDDETKE